MTGSFMCCVAKYSGQVEPLEDFYDEDSRLADVSGEAIEEEDEEEEQQGNQMFFEDTQTAEVTERIANGGKDTAVRKADVQSVSPNSPLWLPLFFSFVVVVFSGALAWYALEQIPIGFCDAGKDTNDFLLHKINERREIEGCHAQWAEGDPDHCPPLPLIPFPHPERCTPCPAHGKCSRLNVECDEGYILRPHLMSFVPPVAMLANGLPGLGPVAFPPKCVIDETRKRSIGAVGKKIDTTLAVERGNRLCAGIDTRREIDGGEGRKWGFEIHHLEDLMRKKYAREVCFSFY